MKKHDYAINWPGQYLTYASISICNYCILKRRRGIKSNKIKRLKVSLNPNEYEYVERDIIFDTYFHAGGRHQTMIDGNLVYKYLQTCHEDCERKNITQKEN